MKLLIFILAFITLSLGVWSTDDRISTGPVTFQVTEKLLMPNVQRFGLNLGFWTSWGAEQLMHNVLKNPGFEGLIDRAVVVVRKVDKNIFWDDDPQLARSEGFWKGGTFDVRSGSLIGQTGVIVDSKGSQLEGFPSYRTDHDLSQLKPGDIIIVTRVVDTELPTHWWIPAGGQRRVTIELIDHRPGSPGKRAIALESSSNSPAEIISYLDAIGDRAGMLLPIKGPWRLSFWVRSVEGGPQLSAEFGREQENPFFSRVITPTQKWSHYVYEFTSEETGSTGLLGLRFQARGGSGRLLLDDVELHPVANNSLAFREEVLEALQRIRPGYLRDWQDQLGDTFSNRVADPFARRGMRYRPGEGTRETKFGYSLNEFLDLCRWVQATPWVIIPPTFSDHELRAFGKYLAARVTSDRFDEILVEFGNENWNKLFRPAGISTPRMYGQVAERAFRMIREGAGPNAPIRTVVNGQHANPSSAFQFARHTKQADYLAVAPYFLHSLDHDMSPTERVEPLFAGDEGRLKTLSRKLVLESRRLAVSEVNLHTTDGDATEEVRNQIVTGRVAGPALAKRLLDALDLGIQPQCVWVLSGFDFQIADREQFVRLWGITRDLGATNRLRPTGLALSMLNQAVGGHLYESRSENKSEQTQVRVSAFGSQSGWSLAVVSWAPKQSRVHIHFPKGSTRALPKRLLVLESPFLDDTNEEYENVRIVERRISQYTDSLQFDVPAWSMAVLLPI